MYSSEFGIFGFISYICALHVFYTSWFPFQKLIIVCVISTSRLYSEDYFHMSDRKKHNK